jgi:hypothetical protein
MPEAQAQAGDAAAQGQQSWEDKLWSVGKNVAMVRMKPDYTVGATELINMR